MNKKTTDDEMQERIDHKFNSFRSANSWRPNKEDSELIKSLMVEWVESENSVIKPRTEPAQVRKTTLKDQTYYILNEKYTNNAGDKFRKDQQLKLNALGQLEQCGAKIGSAAISNFVVTNEIQPNSFEKELANLINRHSIENKVGMPDFMLANYLLGCINNLSDTVRARDDWFNGDNERISQWSIDDTFYEADESIRTVVHVGDEFIVCKDNTNCHHAYLTILGDKPRPMAGYPKTMTLEAVIADTIKHLHNYNGRLTDER